MMDNDAKVLDLTEKLAQEVLDACPCRATTTADGITTQYVCETPEQRDVLAKILEKPSVIKVERKIVSPAED